MRIFNNLKKWLWKQTGNGLHDLELTLQQPLHVSSLLVLSASLLILPVVYILVIALTIFELLELITKTLSRTFSKVKGFITNRM